MPDQRACFTQSLQARSARQARVLHELEGVHRGGKRPPLQALEFRVLAAWGRASPRTRGAASRWHILPSRARNGLKSLQFEPSARALPQRKHVPIRGHATAIRSCASKATLRRADDAVGERDGRAVAAEAADIAHPARVAATSGVPAGAAHGVVGEALQEAVARSGDVCTGTIAGALQAARQAAGAARAIGFLPAAAAAVLARARLTVAVQRASATGSAGSAHPAAVDVGLVLVVHEVVAARHGAGAVAANAGGTVRSTTAGAASGAARAGPAAIEARLTAILQTILARWRSAALRRRRAEKATRAICRAAAVGALGTTRRARPRAVDGALSLVPDPVRATRRDTAAARAVMGIAVRVGAAFRGRRRRGLGSHQLAPR